LLALALMAVGARGGDGVPGRQQRYRPATPPPL